MRVPLGSAARIAVRTVRSCIIKWQAKFSGTQRVGTQQATGGRGVPLQRRLSPSKRGITRYLCLSRSYDVHGGWATVCLVVRQPHRSTPRRGGLHRARHGTVACLRRAAGRGHWLRVKMDLKVKMNYNYRYVSISCMLGNCYTDIIELFWARLQLARPQWACRVQY